MRGGPIVNVAPFRDFDADILCRGCGHPLVIHWEFRGGFGCPMCNEQQCPVSMRENLIPDFAKPPEERTTSMSAVNLCERCGSLMLGKAVATIVLQKDPSKATEKIEFCPGCLNDFLRLMETKPDREKETYREPWKETHRPESMLMLERGTCGEKYQDKYLCLRAKDHDGLHRDGEIEW